MQHLIPAGRIQLREGGPAAKGEALGPVLPPGVLVWRQPLNAEGFRRDCVRLGRALEKFLSAYVSRQLSALEYARSKTLAISQCKVEDA